MQYTLDFSNLAKVLRLLLIDSPLSVYLVGLSTQKPGYSSVKSFCIFCIIFSLLKEVLLKKICSGHNSQFLDLNGKLTVSHSPKDLLKHFQDIVDYKEVAIMKVVMSKVLRMLLIDSALTVHLVGLSTQKQSVEKQNVVKCETCTFQRSN